MIYKRSEFKDPRMKYSPSDISKYNNASYEHCKNGYGILVVHDLDKWKDPILIKEKENGT